MIAKASSDSDDPSADAQHVHVVVFDALVSRIGVMANRRADPGDLVRRHADADADCRTSRCLGRPVPE